MPRPGPLRPAHARPRAQMLAHDHHQQAGRVLQHSIGLQPLLPRSAL